MLDVDDRRDDAFLTTQFDGRDVTIQLRGEEWRSALESQGCTSFQFHHREGSFTAQCEPQKGRRYWYAYRRTGGRRHKVYLGKLETLTLVRMVRVATKLSQHVLTRPAAEPLRVSRAPERPRLPAWRDQLIGRERELALVAELLVRDDVALVTLTGAGGSGKTRLAVELAAKLAPRFEHGVCFVQLAPISDPGLVPSTVAQSLGVHEAGGRPLEESLTAFLGDRQMLLVLDNFEHLLPAAPFVSELLAVCPSLTILVTSRSVLRLSGEYDVPVPPLALPEQPALPPDQLVQYDAVRLFIERARAADVNFVVTAANAPSVAEICSRLDGLPLAIELAAPRIRLLTAQALLSRLEPRLPLLVSGAIDLPHRQRTLHGAIAWSHDLLSAGERALFRGLAVFVGGCTLAAVEAVIGRVWQLMGRGGTEPSLLTPGLPESEFPSVLDGLALLIDKSMLRREEQSDGQPRYVMLETIREYALEQLEASGEAGLFRQCHAEYFSALAEAADDQFWTPHLAVWTERLRLEFSNIRAALDWCGSVRPGCGSLNGLAEDRAHVGLELAGALCRFWDVLGRIREGRERLTAMLALAPERSAARVRALNAAGFLAWAQGDSITARTLLEEGLALARDFDHPERVAFAMVFLGCSLRQAGDLDHALLLLEGSLPWWDRARSNGGRSLALFWLADALRAAGHVERARSCLDEGLELSLKLHDHFGSAFHAAAMGRLASSQMDHTRANELLRQALIFWRDIGDVRDVGVGLDSLGVAAANQGQLRRAAQFFGAAAAVHERPELVQNPIWHDDHVRAVEVTRGAIGETAFAAAWEKGRALPLDRAIALALEADHPGAAEDVAASQPAPMLAPSARADDSGLSRREREVALLISRGFTNREIAQKLVVVERTVESHVTHILSKLALRSRAQVAAWVVRQGWYVPPGA